jgi:hypothetical protein
MTMDITIISFIIGGAFVAIGILGNGVEIKELKISKLSNSLRILAVIGGVAFILLPVYMSDQNDIPHPPIDTAYEKPPSPDGPSQDKTLPPEKTAKEQTSPPMDSAYEKTPSFNEPSYIQTQPPVEFVYEKTPPSVAPANHKTPPPEVTPYNKTASPLKKPTKKTPSPVVTPYKSDVFISSEYSVPNDKVRNVSEGTTYKIRITRGFNSEIEAAQGLSEIHFSVRLDGEALYPQGDPGTVLDSNGWQVYQEYQTNTFRKGVNYSLIGTTYKKPEIYLDSRKVIIKCE